MTEFTILPLNAGTAWIYLKHMLTLASWCSIVSLGLMIYWRSRQPWWTLFAAAYAIQISKIVIDGIRTKMWPLPIQSGAWPEEPLIQYEESGVTALSAVPTISEHTHVVIGQAGFWDLTAVLLAIGMTWAYSTYYKKIGDDS